MQASSATTASPALVAQAIRDLWLHIMRGSGRRLFAVIGEYDLTLTQVKLLDVLGSSAGEPSVKDSSEQIGCSLANASRAVDTLQRRGWIERREDPADRRVKRLSLTPEGAGVVHRINTARLEGLEAFAGALTDHQRTALLAALTDLPHVKDHS